MTLETLMEQAVSILPRAEFITARRRRVLTLCLLLLLLVPVLLEQLAAGRSTY
jgi:hypothetical protein